MLSPASQQSTPKTAHCERGTSLTGFEPVTPGFEGRCSFRTELQGQAVVEKLLERGIPCYQLHQSGRSAPGIRTRSCRSTSEGTLQLDDHRMNDDDREIIEAGPVSGRSLCPDITIGRGADRQDLNLMEPDRRNTSTRRSPRIIDSRKNDGAVQESNPPSAGKERSISTAADEWWDTGKSAVGEPQLLARGSNPPPRRCPEGRVRDLNSPLVRHRAEGYQLPQPGHSVPARAGPWND